MNIVDRQHAAEVISNKGKAFKYDAVECMLIDLKKKDAHKFSLYLVSPYDMPNKLIDANLCTYLISEAVSSPMGANLSAFINKSEALNILKENKGEIYTWKNLNRKYIENHIIPYQK